MILLYAVQTRKSMILLLNYGIIGNFTTGMEKFPTPNTRLTMTTIDYMRAAALVCRCRSYSLVC